MEEIVTGAVILVDKYPFTVTKYGTLELISWEWW